MSNIYNCISFFLFLVIGEDISIIALWSNGPEDGIDDWAEKEGF